jgi:hypothetical protein
VARSLLVGGSLAALMGAALILPVFVARLESGELTRVGIGVVSVGGIMIACGMTAVLMGLWQRRGSAMPSGVRIAVAANVLVLAFFALELSDRLVRQDGKVVYWSTFLFPPALLLFYGVLAGRRWAWWISRGAFALAALWFLGFVAVIPFANLHGEGGPVPWDGRLYMACVSLVFAGILAGAFRALGRLETRIWFGLVRMEGNAAAEPRSAPDGTAPF